MALGSHLGTTAGPSEGRLVLIWGSSRNALVLVTGTLGDHLEQCGSCLGIVGSSGAVWESSEDRLALAGEGGGGSFGGDLR